MATYGGDEVSALVIDMGTQWTKVGYAGEDTPRAVLPTDLGVLEDASVDAPAAAEAMAVDGAEGGSAVARANRAARKTYIGTSTLSIRRDGMEIVNPIRNGLVENWDLAEALWDHAFANELRLTVKEHPVLFAEPTHAPASQREKLTEIFFEKYNVPAFYVSKSAVLAAFQAGKPSALVLDCGAGQTSVTPVVDGVALKQGSVRQPLGGHAVSDLTLAYLEQVLKTAVNPRYLVVERREPGKPWNPRVRDLGKTAPSYHAWARRALAADFKESVVQVPLAPFQDEEAKLAQLPTKPYEFPDGFLLQAGVDRFRLGETFFQPAKYYDVTLIKGVGSGDELVGVHQLVAHAIRQVDPDIAGTLLASTVVTGGSTLTPGFVDRLGSELTQMLASNKLKLNAAGSTIERRFAAWIGGSILASLGSFQQMWMSKQDYDEGGRSVLEQKFH